MSGPSTSSPTHVDLRTTKLLGLIIPSSNTAVEALVPAILASLRAQHPSIPTILPIVTRISVTSLDASASTAAQFSPATFTAAARLLADAAVDAIVWAGTSGMFAGGDLAADRALAAAMTEAAGGIPCSTATLAFAAALDALATSGDDTAAREWNLAIAVPYPAALTAKVTDFWKREGFRVPAAESMTPTPASNREIGRCRNVDMEAVVRRAVAGMPKGGKNAVLLTCTNWPVAPLVEGLEREMGDEVMLLDSIAVIAWHGIRMVMQAGEYNEGSKSSLAIKGWGRLLESF